MARQILEANPGALIVLNDAEDEARRLGQARIGSEHLLLGFVLESERTDAQALQRTTAPVEAEEGGANVLERVGVDAGALRAAIESVLPPAR